jgi:hypothetical protein
MNDLSSNGRNLMWSGLLAAGGFILGLVLLCIAPFAAVAAVAARTLPVRLALATVGAMWLGGQICGFAFHHYPHALSTYALGAAIAVAALAATLAVARIRILPLAFLAAFAVYEGVQYAFALVFGGSETFTPAVVFEILEGNVLGFAIFWALRLVAAAAGITPEAKVERKTSAV